MKAKFKKGDLVLIEYKPIDPVCSLMFEDDFQIGIIDEIRTMTGNIVVESQPIYDEIGRTYKLLWPPECLTLISRGEFEMV